MLGKIIENYYYNLITNKKTYWCSLKNLVNLKNKKTKTQPLEKENKMNVTYFDMLIIFTWTIVLTMPLAYATVKTCEFVDALIAKKKESIK